MLKPIRFVILFAAFSVSLVAPSVPCFGGETDNLCGIIGASNGLVACSSPATLHGNSAPFNSESGFIGGRSDPGTALYPLFAFNLCRYVDNISSPARSFFVPFNSRTEWLAFIQKFSVSTDSTISLTTCGVPATMPLSPNSACLFSVPSHQYVELGYGRTGSQVQKTAAFLCTVKGLCNTYGCGADQAWTQRVNATYLALNADVDSPSWKLVNLAYEGTPPEPNSAPQPSCVPTSETQSLSCPSGQIGSWIQQRDYTCPDATWGEWRDITNTCASSCSSTSETQTLSCPSGQAGLWVQQRDYTCPDATWSSWYDITNTCVSTTCSSPYGTQGQTYGICMCDDSSYMGSNVAPFVDCVVDSYYADVFKCKDGTWVHSSLASSPNCFIASGAGCSEIGLFDTGCR